MKSRLSILAIVGVGGALLAPVIPARAGADAASSKEFEANVAPFLKQNCVRCHGADKKPKSGFRVDTLRGVVSPKGDETENLAHILKRLQSRDMPPKGEPAPDATQTEAVIHWIRTELRKVGRDNTGELAYPNMGNYLDHKLLFGAPSKAAAATPSRNWRVSPFQYWTMMERFKPHQGGYQARLPNPFGLTSDHGFRDYAFRYTVGAAEVQQMMLNARTVVGHLARGGDSPSRILSTLAKQKQPATDAQIQKAVAWLFEQHLLRPPTDDEQNRYSDSLAKSLERFGNEKGVVEGLAPIFLHPEGLFRIEIGAGPRDEFGRVFLSPRELSFAIAFALTDKVPDAPLQAAVREGRLGDREAARKEVVRILNDPAIDKPRILRFFQEYFGYDRAINVFKDRPIVQEQFISAKSLVEDTDRLVMHILESDKNVLYELLTTPKSYVQSGKIKQALDMAAKGKDIRRDSNHHNWLGMYYNLTPDQWRAEQPITLPAQQRAGVLTQPSWLFANSDNKDGHAIHRGKWVYEHLLGGTIPDVPITVDAKLPDEPHHSLRERMRFTREAYCWTCHQRMNPIGLSFEMFDGSGQFRSEEIIFIKKPSPKGDKKGDKIEKATLPADASGGVMQSIDPTLDGPAGNAIELIHRLAKSDHVHQVFVRHAFRYWMGRNETLDDAPTLQAAHKAYQDSGGSMKALIASLLTSDSFLYRRPADTQVETIKAP